MIKFIEVHRKDFFGTVSRFSIPIEKIYQVREEKHGTEIVYARTKIDGALHSAKCIESYDEVMRRILY